MIYFSFVWIKKKKQNCISQLKLLLKIHHINSSEYYTSNLKRKYENSLLLKSEWTKKYEKILTKNLCLGCVFADDWIEDCWDSNESEKMCNYFWNSERQRDLLFFITWSVHRIDIQPATFDGILKLNWWTISFNRPCIVVLRSEWYSTMSKVTTRIRYIMYITAQTNPVP